MSNRFASTAFKVADMAGPGFDASKYALPQMIHITTDDGLEIPAAVTYPVDFDPSKKYPVHFEIYGGPNTAYVRERWVTPSASNQWWSEHGIITVTADTRGGSQRPCRHRPGFPQPHRGSGQGLRGVGGLFPKSPLCDSGKDRR
jgi:hypothetical protein